MGPRMFVGGFLPLLCLRKAGVICTRMSMVAPAWRSAGPLPAVLWQRAGRWHEPQAPAGMNKLFLVVLADGQGEPKAPSSVHAVER